MTNANEINIENINSHLMKKIFGNNNIYNNEYEDGDTDFAIITSENDRLTMKKLKKKQNILVLLVIVN
jgi:hypothetical protein